MGGYSPNHNALNELNEGARNHTLPSEQGPHSLDFGELELPGPGASTDPFAAPMSRPAEIGSLGETAPQKKRTAPSLSIGSVYPPASSAGANIGGISASEVPPMSAMSQAGEAGGMGFGEVDLGGSSAEDDMEFGAIPQEAGQASVRNIPGHGATSARSRAAGEAETAEEQVAPRSPRRTGRYLVAVLAMTLVGGASLEFTKHGAFGRNDITDRLHEKPQALQLQEAMKRTRAAFGADALNRATDALTDLERDTAAAPRSAKLLAYAAYANFAHEVRFGKDAQRDARALSLLSRVPTDGVNKRLATAARDLVIGQLKTSRTTLKELLRDDPLNVEVAWLLGDLELRAKLPKDAAVAYKQANDAEESARAQSGLMQAAEAMGDLDSAVKEATAIAAKYPDHAPSRLFLAKVSWQRKHDEQATTKWLTELQRPGVVAGAAIADQVDALTLRGTVLLERGRVTEARAAFEAAALAARGTPAAGPQVGLGELNMETGQYAAAIANFKGASEADPTLTVAKIGVARADLKLEKPGEAKAVLTALVDPQYAGDIGYWLGQAEEKLSPDKPAVPTKIYEEAIKAQPTSVSSYIALANLQSKSGRSEDADATLAKALKQVPPSDQLFLGIGNLRFRQGRYEDALTNYGKALALQPENLEALFAKAKSLLRLGPRENIELGKSVLEQVEKRDSKYPGLALEWGFYFQATNQIDEALKRYQSALDAAPNDVDVKLQVGRAMVESRDPKAEERLRQVLDSCSTGSVAPDICTLEAKHYLGRALLNKGAFGDALVFLKQAAEKGDLNAAYHLYYGWALQELARLEEARGEITRAIELDKSLGDAYWLNAEILAKQQLYKQAIVQAKQALSLSPSRHEAHATMAFSYKGLNDEPAALREWAIAIKNDPRNPNAPFWRFQVADTKYHQGNVQGATTDLEEALKDLAAAGAKPTWLPKAHFYLGEALRSSNRAVAVKEYRAYLDTSVGSTDPARADAKQALVELGAPYGVP
ncbi:MAG: hypothetical protein NVSMB1_13010 [Polyangiales bacterium]